jgi:hypothetical protein
MDYLALKSGSDVRGVAVGEDAVLTPEVPKPWGKLSYLSCRKRRAFRPES